MKNKIIYKKGFKYVIRCESRSKYVQTLVDKFINNETIPIGSTLKYYGTQISNLPNYDNMILEIKKDQA